MLANTFALMGIDALPVKTEVDCSDGLPKTVLVGSVDPIQAITSALDSVARHD